MRRLTIPVALLIVGLGLGCRGPTPKLAPTPSAQPNLGGAGAMLVADLQYVDISSGMTFFSLQRDGVFRAGKRIVGRLDGAGTFVFDDTQGRVTATLSENGRIAIIASEGTDLAAIPGRLGRLLTDFEGRVESGYTLGSDATATIALGNTLAFDDQGRLADREMMVKGLTPQTRRTAMFLYLVLAMITQ
ncbi:MAG: hypothetical protein IPL79_16160 [Myxococcales bacterium]|nr:hypothetical protein [Myxococcales bacterium]